MAQKTKMSQSEELSPSRGQLSSLEKEVQELIDAIGQYLEYHKTKHKDSLDNSMGEHLNKLRQYMRTVRRWRNGSLACGVKDCDILTDYLHKTYRELLTTKAKDLNKEVEHIDEFISILDEDSNNLRQNMDDDIQTVQKQISSFGPDETQSNFKRNYDASGLHKLKETDTFLKELHQAVQHLQLKIRENNDKLGENLSMQSSNTAPSNHTPKSFELNPARNRVLATADTIRKTLRSLKSGCHLEMGSTSQKQIQNCADNDIEVLRRQLRKVRRWQQSMETFYDEDVDDLLLIISAIERHVGEGNESRSETTSKPDTGKLTKTEKSAEPAKTSPATASTKSVGSSSSDTDSYTGPPSTDSEAPPSYEDACNAQITVRGINYVATENTEADDTLDENAEFSERLI